MPCMDETEVEAGVMMTPMSFEMGGRRDEDFGETDDGWRKPFCMTTFAEIT